MVLVASRHGRNSHFLWETSDVENANSNNHCVYPLDVIEFPNDLPIFVHPCYVHFTTPRFKRMENS